MTLEKWKKEMASQSKEVIEYAYVHLSLFDKDYEAKSDFLNELMLKLYFKTIAGGGRNGK